MAKKQGARSPQTTSRRSGLVLERIVSGGQTGVDRAALEVGLALHLKVGGWCPRGRRAEDGRIPARYPLRETDSSEYWVRTEQNVLEADATLILFREALRGGTAFTFRMTQKHGQPCLCVDLSASDATAPLTTYGWLVEQKTRTLNVAGPRESTAAGIQDQAEQFLFQVLRH